MCVGGVGESTKRGPHGSSACVHGMCFSAFFPFEHVQDELHQAREGRTTCELEAARQSAALLEATRQLEEVGASSFSCSVAHTGQPLAVMQPGSSVMGYAHAHARARTRTQTYTHTHTGHRCAGKQGKRAGCGRRHRSTASSAGGAMGQCAGPFVRQTIAHVCCGDSGKLASPSFQNTDLVYAGARRNVC